MWPYDTPLWDKISRAITPESHAESIVNEIYGQENRMPDVPEILSRYEPEYSSFPAPMVSTGQYVQKTVARITGTFGDAITKYAIIAIAIVLVGLFLYGFIPALGRKYGGR